MSKFYISDLHFDHKNVISYDNRPFYNIEEMNKTLIDNWNSVVTKNDYVYILGDMFWNNNNAENILSQLNGQKYLIRGNHDRLNSSMEKYFVWVKDYAEIKDNGRTVVLCHFPMPCFKNQCYGDFHLYGHVHNGFEWHMIEHFKQEIIDLYEKPCNMFNVGCMISYMNYTPRTLDEIVYANE